MQTDNQPASAADGHVCSTDELGPLPDCVATIGTDGHPRHIKHWWGIVEAKLYGPPQGLYTADQLRDYAAQCVAAERERMNQHAVTLANTDSQVAREHAAALAHALKVLLCDAEESDYMTGRERELFARQALVDYGA